MNKFVIIAAASLVLSSGAHAVDAEKAKALAQSKNCLACHAIDKKLVGPAYTEVSKKYKGNKDAEAMLIKRSSTAAVACGARSRCHPTPSRKTKRKYSSTGSCRCNSATA